MVALMHKADQCVISHLSQKHVIRPRGGTQNIASLTVTSLTTQLLPSLCCFEFALSHGDVASGMHRVLLCVLGRGEGPEELTAENKISFV